MALTTRQLHIGGMSCPNCALRIRKALEAAPGVVYAQVNDATGQALLRYDEAQLSMARIGDLLEELGYELIAPSDTLIRTASLLVILLGLSALLQQTGLLNLLVPSRLADSGMGYGMLFVTGLLTSVHCIAMCGGINLSQSLPREGSRAGTVRYNGGRVLSYTVIGFLLGLLGLLLGGGGQLGVSPLLQGILKMLAGLLMLFSGLRTLGLFPALPWPRLRPPSRLRARSAFAVGLLNGLMPCGPLQSIQLVALASGNPITGALSMLFFSLGTVPLMLGFGSAVSLLGRRFAKTVRLAGAVLIAVFGVAMLSQGGILSGMLLPERLRLLLLVLAAVVLLFAIPFPRPAYRRALTGAVLLAALLLLMNQRPASSAGGVSRARLQDGVQLVSSELSPGAYPNISVQAGVPVRWTIRAEADSINGCNYKMILQDLGLEHAFTPGDNLIEFTPQSAGEIRYSCWMGMISGTITVTQ